MSDTYLTPQQLADALGVSDRFVRDKAATGEWPHLRLGERTIRFTEEQVAQIEALSTHVPHQEATDLRARKKSVLKNLHSA